jgi:hypothetical protein
MTGNNLPDIPYQLNRTKITTSDQAQPKHRIFTKPITAVIVTGSIKRMPLDGTNVHSRKQKLAALYMPMAGKAVQLLQLIQIFITVLLTVRLPTHLEKTKSICTINYLYVKKTVLCLKR